MLISSAQAKTRDYKWQLGVFTFVAMIITIFVLSHVYTNEIVSFGNSLLTRFSSTSIYFALFIIATLSSTIIPLPVWIYVFTCVALGFNYIECSIVIALGSSVGSTTSYLLGRYFRETKVFKRRFDENKIQKWKEKSKKYISGIIFISAFSPFPMDVVYAASGIMRYSPLAFVTIITSARVMRFVLMGYLFFKLQ